jgi:8-oxo-dGTP diphosphatase
MQLATLCYLRRDGKTLMMHRIKKKNDIHKNKWNGLGGKFAPGETPEECVIREIKEECGLSISNPKLQGFLTFPSFSAGEDWYVFVFVAREFEGTLIDSIEGHLQWIKDEDLVQLNLWEGDKYFLPLLEQGNFFSAIFYYENGTLLRHHLTVYDNNLK